MLTERLVISRSAFGSQMSHNYFRFASGWPTAAFYHPKEKKKLLLMYFGFLKACSRSVERLRKIWAPDNKWEIIVICSNWLELVISWRCQPISTGNISELISLFYFVTLYFGLKIHANYYVLVYGRSYKLLLNFPEVFVYIANSSREREACLEVVCREDCMDLYFQVLEFQIIVIQ